MPEALSLPTLRLRGVTCTPIEVPLRYVLGTSAAVVRAAPLLQAMAQVLQEAAAMAHGDNVAPLAIAAKVQRRFELIGVTGVVHMALSAFDMDLWDHSRSPSGRR